MDNSGHRNSKYRATMLVDDHLIHCIIAHKKQDQISVIKSFSVDRNQINSDNDIFHLFQLKYTQRHIILSPSDYEILAYKTNAQDIDKSELNKRIATQHKTSHKTTSLDFTPVAHSDDKLFAFRCQNTFIDSIESTFQRYSHSINSLSVLDLAPNGIASTQYIDSKPILSIFLGPKLSRAYIHSTEGIANIIPLPCLNDENFSNTINHIINILLTKTNTTDIKLGKIFVEDPSKNKVNIEQLSKKIGIQLDDISHHPRLMFKTNGKTSSIEALLALCTFNLDNDRAPNRYINLTMDKEIVKDWRYYTNKITLERLGLTLLISSMTTGLLYAQEINKQKQSQQRLEAAQSKSKELEDKAKNYQTENQIIAIGSPELSTPNMHIGEILDTINESFAEINKNNANTPKIWTKVLEINTSKGSLSISGQQVDSYSTQSLVSLINNQVINNPDINTNNTIKTIAAKPTQAEIALSRLPPNERAKLPTNPNQPVEFLIQST
ncbi:MAG: hypothetical protein ACON5A_03465 [Candidatus Comchoanobacterales bacterium]